MAAKEKSPVKTMMIANTILIVGILAVILFLPQKTDGEKVGYFLPKPDPATPPTTPTV